MTATDKYEAVEQAVDDAKRNYGEEIDVQALVELLEASGWRWEG